MEGRKENNKPLNEIRIGFRSRVRNTVNYANILLKENNFRSLHLSAIGGAIGSLVNAVEVLKINNPGLYQVNKIGTVSYQTVDQQGVIQNQRLYPKLEVTLSLDAPSDTNGEGYQEKLSEERRTQLLTVAGQRQRRTDERPRGRPTRGAPRGRGGFRGGRGAPRGGPRGRGGFRGGRGAPRGGPRGYSRGGPRGAPRGRGGFRGPRVNRARGN